MNLFRIFAEFDKAGLSAAQAVRSSFMDSFMQAVAFLFGSEGCTIWAAVIGAYLLMRRQRGDAAFIFLGTALGSALCALLKQVFQRVRPPGGLLIHSYSFPSGHTVSSFVLFFSLAYWWSHRHPRSAVWSWIAAAIGSVIVGSNRVYLGVHWPSDVVGGWMVGILFLLIWILAARRLLSRHAPVKTTA
jgi:undecaprenyl-diphosphatase